MKHRRFPRRLHQQFADLLAQDWREARIMYPVRCEYVGVTSRV
jgi:hypothetical protein